MQQRPFKQIDVFGAAPYRGNPLAVVLDAAGLEGPAMQAFTDWSNLSEASFLLPSTPVGQAAGADYRLRIFCPGHELPFAGHPTLGSCHAWLEAGGRARAPGLIVQECGVGLVRLRQTGTRIAFAAPPLLRCGALDAAELALIARGLGLAHDDILQHAWCDNGPPWRALMLRSVALLRALQPDRLPLAAMHLGLIAAHTQQTAPPASAPDAPDPAPVFEVRAFFPGPAGLTEDPVTGSLNAALAQWLIGAGLAPAQYSVSQGHCLGRAGRVYLAQQGADIWVGGDSVTCITGQVLL